MAVDGDIVRRVGKDEFGLGAVEQAIIGGLVAGITAQQAMATEQPQIADLCDRRAGRGFGDLIFRSVRGAACLARVLQDDVDLRHLEPGQLDIDIEFDQPLQLDRQQLLVPSGLFGELVSRSSPHIIPRATPQLILRLFV